MVTDTVRQAAEVLQVGRSKVTLEGYVTDQMQVNISDMKAESESAEQAGSLWASGTTLV